ncbi:hypothetical protein C7T94_11490 [Pedobacter yulinensis]|uniref:Uncharacterized protein n=1 Tax=Pedobacter yulinensis TaxID=2126353 RepID=A0A2T3HLB1_9SPHI|nr:hypothetical protein C7T94_11490 [Pedobacter yulinensis]
MFYGTQDQDGRKIPQALDRGARVKQSKDRFDALLDFTEESRVKTEKRIARGHSPFCFLQISRQNIWLQLFITDLKC